MASDNQQVEAGLGELRSNKRCNAVTAWGSQYESRDAPRTGPHTACRAWPCLPAMSVQKAALRWPKANMLELRIWTIGLPVPSRPKAAGRR